MKQLTLILALLLAYVSSYGKDPVVKSIPMPFATGISDLNTDGSRMTLDGETLYVPTVDGIWSININAPEEVWTSHGFEGENVMGCIHNGDELLAITRNQYSRLLLHSADNGMTVEDYTPYDLMGDNKYNTVTRLCQDPDDPYKIYLLCSVGILKSTDFGRSWTLLVDECNRNNTYCGFEIHPLDTDILLNHAENGAQAPTIIISYDGGNDWITSSGYPTADIILPNGQDYAEDCIHDVAFHPTDINTWVYGGEGVIAKSTDQGRTWTHKAESWGYQYCTVFDNENHDIIYSVGANDCHPELDHIGFVFMLSTDCGETWEDVFHYKPETQWQWYSDLKQTREHLILLGRQDLFFIDKHDLQNASGVQDVNTIEDSDGNGNLYSIDGTLLKKEISRKDIANLPKGVYIYNGSKIVVN